MRPSVISFSFQPLNWLRNLVLPVLATVLVSSCVNHPGETGKTSEYSVGVIGPHAAQIRSAKVGYRGETLRVNVRVMKFPSLGRVFPRHIDIDLIDKNGAVLHSDVLPLRGGRSRFTKHLQIADAREGMVRLRYEMSPPTIHAH